MRLYFPPKLLQPLYSKANSGLTRKTTGNFEGLAEQVADSLVGISRSSQLKIGGVLSFVTTTDMPLVA